MSKKIFEIKLCEKCNNKFDITYGDIDFYDKISPMFDGKKYSIPVPSLCPDCRNVRRGIWRNEGKLYKRNCDLTGKSLVSIFLPDSKIKVYSNEYWRSDKWDPLEFGIEYNNKLNFFEQFDSLLKRVPFPNVFMGLESENSEYGNHSGKIKDCYLAFASWICERSLYISNITQAVNVVDSIGGNSLEKCYQTIDCNLCHSCFYCINSNNCSNSYFLYDCINCHDCFLCWNLNSKKYCIENKQYTREEYFKKIDFIKKDYLLKGWDFLEEIKDKVINKGLHMTNCENCIGNDISNCKNCENIFLADDLENCKNVDYSIINVSYVYDGRGVGQNFNLGYEIFDTGVDASRVCFSGVCHSCSNTYYSINCIGCLNIFGCIGLRNKEYCIFNKQYTRVEYETLIPKIIEKMIVNKEWGEFFPSNISPFAYNETIAQEYFPLKREEAIEKGFKWSDYESPLPKVEKIIKANLLPDNIENIPDDILNWAIECEITKRPFKIIKEELDFYRKYSLPIPKRHPEKRHFDRIKIRKPRKIYDRICDKCYKEIKSIYNSLYPGKVYCEDCYNKSIY